jgi:arsenite-transporting ATPase
VKIFKRFYIFTGKGGVGKTTLSLAFTKNLQTQNKKVKYVYFKTSKLGQDSINHNETLGLAKEIGVDTLGLDLYESSKSYIGKKLNSKTVASWIIKTPFFKSLINMIPGFNYLIYMGQILELLDEDPELILVLDSPSSGHAQTMLEATGNFNEIFQSGVIYEDTNKMMKLITNTGFLKIIIVSIPTLLALHEAKELKENICSSFNYDVQTVCNNCLSTYQELELPDFLIKKINNETSAIDESDEPIKEQIPYLMSKSPSLLIKDLGPSMQNLV